MIEYILEFEQTIYTDYYIILIKQISRIPETGHFFYNARIAYQFSEN